MRTRSLAEYPETAYRVRSAHYPAPANDAVAAVVDREADTPAERADRTDDSAVLYAVLARMDADSAQRGRWTPFSARRRNTSRRSFRSASVFAARDLRRAAALRDSQAHPQSARGGLSILAFAPRTLAHRAGG